MSLTRQRTACKITSNPSSVRTWWSQPTVQHVTGSLFGNRVGTAVSGTFRHSLSQAGSQTWWHRVLLCFSQITATCCFSSSQYLLNFPPYTNFKTLSFIMNAVLHEFALQCDKLSHHIGPSWTLILMLLLPSTVLYVTTNYNWLIY